MTMYFADNKDIRDLLDISRQRLTLEVLKEFLLRRGIIVSDEATKADLFEQISMWTLDLDDLNWLLDKTARNDRAERYTSASIPGDFSDTEIRKAVVALKKRSGTPQLDSLKFTKTAKGHFLLAATYSELDPAKTRLRQKRIRDGSVRLEVGPNGLNVRHEANERMTAVADALMKALAASKSEVVQARKIDLSHLSGGESRTAFFLNLIQGVAGMTLSDVSKVQVERSMSPTDAEEASSEHNFGDIEKGSVGAEPDDLADNAGASNPEDEADLELVGNQVRGAILRGASLLTSPEFQMLKKHFFLFGMEWTSEETSEKGKIVQFEAAFENSQECSGFRYKVKGVIDRKKTNNSVEFLKTSRPCTAVENAHYMKLLEEASRQALVSVDPSVATDTPTDVDVKSCAGAGSLDTGTPAVAPAQGSSDVEESTEANGGGQEG